MKYIGASGRETVNDHDNDSALQSVQNSAFPQEITKVFKITQFVRGKLVWDLFMPQHEPLGVLL